MHDAIGMHGSHCCGNFIKNVASLLLRKIVFVNNNIKQLFSLTILSNDVLIFCFFEHLVNFKDAGMVLRANSRTFIGEGVPSVSRGKLR